MDDNRVWRLLPAAHADIPVLLVSATFGPASYAVYITDLANVWSESLGRREIFMRAFKENTTIDPSYDNEQMAVFLGKIRAAFDASLPDHADTRLTMATEASDGDDLLVHITSILPQGLQPLKWPLYLKKRPLSAITSELVLPLIHDRGTRLRETEALVAALRDKDAVIGKFADKLEAIGAGVESAFPALAGRRKITRTDIERRVKGLAPFDEDAFRKQFSKGGYEGSVGSGGEAPDASKLFEGVFGGANELRCDSEAVAPVSHSLDAWWKELGTGNGVSLGRTQKKASDQQAAGASVPVEDDAGNQSDDSFQTTPHRPVATKKAVDGREDVDEIPSPSSKKTGADIAKPKAGLGKIGRLGALGKKKAASPPPTKESDDETASEADDKPSEAGASPEPEPATKRTREDAEDTKETEPTPTITTTSLRTKPARGGLGRIGGKKDKEPAPESLEAPSPPPPPETKAPVSARPAMKGLGRIGKSTPVASNSGARRTEGDADDRPGKLDIEDASKRKAQDETKVAQPTTEEEKIPDSRRAEMLQQAVEKHAAPVRKKRKF